MTLNVLATLENVAFTILNKLCELKASYDN